MSAPLVVAIAGPAPGVGEHKHCEACGKSIAVDGRVCSEACVARVREAHRLKKRSVYIVMGMVLVLLILTVYGGQIFGRA